MVNKKLSLFLITLFLLLGLIFPQKAKAIDLQDVVASGESLIVKVQETVEYFFAFKVENKIQVLEKQAEKRLVMAQGYAEEGNEERVQNQLQNYLQIKEKQNNLLGGNDMGEVLGAVAERTVEQQKTMEELKTKIEGETKQNIIQVQERVVNQVAERIVEVNGKEGQTEFFEKVEHVWAPGTGPGGEAGVVIEGGTMQFAPGTSAGGPSGADIKSNVVETGGGSGGGQNVEVNNSGTSSEQGGGTTVVGQ